MKLGVSSYSFSKLLKKDMDYIEVCNKAKEIGFSGIEFTTLYQRYHKSIDVLEEAKNIRRHCERIGLEIIAYTVGANLIGENEKDEVEKLLFHIDVAKELGAPLLRHDVCYLPRDSKDVPYREIIEKIAPEIRKITSYAKQKGIRTCTENHGFVFQAPEIVKELILAVGDSNYGWLCDIGNFLCVDAEPVSSVRIAAPYTFHVHAKDFLYKTKDTGECPFGYFKTASGNYLLGTVVGRGIVPVKECIKILKDANYDSWLSLEFEGLEEPIEAIKEGFEFLAGII